MNRLLQAQMGFIRGILDAAQNDEDSKNVFNLDVTNFPKVLFSYRFFSPKVSSPCVPSIEVFENSTLVNDIQTKEIEREKKVFLFLDPATDDPEATNKLKSLTTSFIEGTSSKFKTSFFTFPAGGVIKTDFVESLVPYKKVIESIQGFASQAHLDCLHDRCRDFGPDTEKSQIKAIVLLTHGGNKLEKFPADSKAVKYFSRTCKLLGISVVSVVLQPGEYSLFAEESSATTSGIFLKSPSNDFFFAACLDLLDKEEMNRIIKVEYSSPKPKYDGAWRELVVKSEHFSNHGRGFGRFQTPRRRKKN